MNARSKAYQLFEKFYKTSILKNRMKYEAAKKLAEMCVDEIINSNPHSNPLYNEYWQEVKQEIQNL